MRIACFPLTPNVEVILRHQDCLKPNTIQSIISFHEDKSSLNKLQQKSKILCTTSVEEGLKEADSVVLFDDWTGSRWDKFFMCIEYAIQHSISVYSSRFLLERIPEHKTKKDIIELQHVHTMMLRYADPRLLDIKTPILAVLGVGECTGKLECEIELKEYLDSIDCKSEILCSNSIGELYGMNTLPKILFDTNVSFPEKVLRFNQYVYDLCVKTNPDILVIGVPGGIVSLTEKESNYFAEIPLIISTAVHIDYGILAFYYVLHTEENFLSNLMRYCRNRYQIDIPAFYMSRQMMTYEQEGSKIKHLFLSDEYMHNHPSDLYKHKRVAAPNKKNEAVFQILTDLLQENPETI